MKDASLTLAEAMIVVARELGAGEYLRSYQMYFSRWCEELSCQPQIDAMHHMLLDNISTGRWTVVVDDPDKGRSVISSDFWKSIPADGSGLRDLKQWFYSSVFNGVCVIPEGHLAGEIRIFRSSESEVNAITRKRRGRPRLPEWDGILMDTFGWMLSARPTNQAEIEKHMHAVGRKLVGRPLADDSVRRRAKKLFEIWETSVCGNEGVDEKDEKSPS